MPFIARRTDRGIPRYRDADHTDTFLFGAEDLVPVIGVSGPFVETRILGGTAYEVHRFRPRIETDFSRIERWRSEADGETHWRVTTPGNVTSILGESAAGRIADPDDPNRVFAWMLEFTYDDKGNCIEYTYRPEDLVGVDIGLLSERHRLDARSTVANTYLKRVRYGNAVPFHPRGSRPGEFHFEMVFDFGEHDAAAPAPGDAADWAMRPDPFSSYRSGFEIRTYRLCRGVLMFHRFPELGPEPQLVRSLRLTHATQAPGLSFLVEAELAGHIPAPGGGYSTKTLPPLTIDYQALEWFTAIQEIDDESIRHLPAGVDGLGYRWVDFEGTGLTGVLTETTDAWFFKPNLGDGRLGPLQPVRSKPSFEGLRQGTLQLIDIEADGRRHAVSVGAAPQGSFAPDDEGNWEPFRPFDSAPALDPSSSSARLVDLTGDGRPDLLVDEDDAVCWYASRGADGFAAPERVRRRLDEDATPQLVFAGASDTIFLADMSGDGLPDIVRIRNGNIAYWPNLGYGRFAAKVVMDDAPRLDHPDAFDPRRIRLADVDGSGTADLVYVGQDRLRLWTNASGNGWSTGPLEIDPYPGLHSEADIDVVDLLGTGTACIVWSSPLASDDARPLRYIDLTASRKPHLMTGYRNNTGRELLVSYTPSTHFYLEDAAAGTAWITKLPFPVQCVSTVELIDHVTSTRLRSRYTYHHGHYDRSEREFRGFGRVDQLDTETFEGFNVLDASNVVEEALHQPPVLTKTWFHTGQWIGGEKVLRHFADEYYTNVALPEQPLPEHVLPADLTPEEQRQAVRACKGSALRREVYALDATHEEPHPYLVTENSCAVELIQAQDELHHATFLVTPEESITYQYERLPADPRVLHTLVLDRDELGNVLRAASVVYGRATTDGSLPASVQAMQSRTLVMVAEAEFTNDVDTDIPVPAYRLRVPRAARAYELTGLTPADRFFTRDEFRDAYAAATDIPFEATPSGGGQRRLLGEQRTRYLRNDLSGGLPFGMLESLSLPFEAYRLAFTPSLLADLYGGRVDAVILTAAGYVQIDGAWWIPSTRSVFDADSAQHFFRPMATRDPFGNETSVTYDAHDLLVESVTDSIGNVNSAGNDYRTLSPVLTVDPNLNRTMVQRDEIGMVTAAAVMGKAGAGEGDTLLDPTVRVEYDLTEWLTKQKPNFVRTISREQHGAGNPRFQESYAYADGFGNVAMSKVQAEPGLARRFDPVTGLVEDVDTTPDVRWVGNGRTVLNNKGNPVRQYEPYFSVTHEYEDAAELVETGATTVTYYDPLDRVVRTEMPNGTFTKTDLDPWRQFAYDANDTVLHSTWYVERGSPDPAVDPEPADPEERAAWLAAMHANTPGVAHLDALGRATFSLADNGPDGVRSMRAELDTAGSRFRLFDSLGRLVASAQSNLGGVQSRSESAERGEQRVLLDVVGNLVWAEDSVGRVMRLEYDSLHRPLHAFLTDGGPEILVGFNLWGEQHPDSVQRNLRGRLYRTFDQSGVTATMRHDFKGNPERNERRFAVEYRAPIDWSALLAAGSAGAVEAAAEPLLEAEVFANETQHDALNRVTAATLVDGTQLRPSYNEANILESLEARIRGLGGFDQIVLDQDYDAKGQLLRTELGNGTVVHRTYDPMTFRLTNLVTQRIADGTLLQDLAYTYDPVGNPTECSDDAQQTAFFSNAVVEPVWRYAYNALYELVTASGREHAGIPTPSSHLLPGAETLPHQNDATALRTYTENYTYDELGNLMRAHHGAGAGTWDRRYRYAFQDDPGERTNRLSATSLPGDGPLGPFSATYDYDVTGNMTRMPHLASLEWNANGQLREVDLGGGGIAFYVYSGGSQRVRKVIERTPTVRRERLYLGAVEVEREVQNGTVVMARETLHLGSGHGRVAEAITKTIDAADPAALGQTAMRYQYGNLQGSASLEADENGSLISYEEYHPYGTTAYRSGRSAADASLKRYRYIGQERDDETGLYLFGLRYYAPWLGRWLSADPVGLAGGLNMYAYSSNNPVAFSDPAGTQEEDVHRTRALVLSAEEQRTYRGRSSEAARRELESLTSGRLVRTVEGELYQVTGVEYERGVGWVFSGTQVLEVTVEGTTEEGPGGAGDTPPATESETRATPPSRAAPETPSPTPRPSGQAEATESEAEPATSGIPRAARTVVEEAARPRSATGARPRGTLHLWSGPGKATAQASIRSQGSGWMMGDIDGTPTPQHIAGEQEFARARAAAPGGNLTQAEFERIWGPRSAEVVGRGAFSGHPVQSHGNPGPNSIQRRYEWPARAIGGGIRGPFVFGTGMFSAIVGAQDPNPVWGVSLAILGVGEATSGIIYGSGAILGATEAMAIGSAGATAFGGLGAAVGFGVASGRAFARGDNVGGFVNALGAIGGLLLIASLFTPVGWVGLLGVGLVALAGGFNLGRWLGS